MVSRLLGALILVALPTSVAAQTSLDTARREAHAVRVSRGAVRVDGRLDEEIWRTAPALAQFVQREPVEGAPATDAMEIRFAYDDDALYVGARMWSSGTVQAPMGRRDEGLQAEHIEISLDTYLDRRTAYTFGVTAAGVRLDRYHPTDDNASEASDTGFDPVWEARTFTSNDGWMAELWIPFAQLRFNERNPQVWGLNVRRWTPSRNEEVFWALVPRTQKGWASRFGDLHGLDGILPRRRIELLPYVAAASQVVGDRSLDNPFTGGANLEGRTGLDMKVGLGPNLTLEAAANPDFGQVEADPAEVNLSAFETFFPERRPFFVERSQLIAGNVISYFYSRRIGAAPIGRASGDFVDHPATSTILGAAKLTGRLASGTSIGALGAVTSEESARTFSLLPSASGSAQFGRVRVAPRTTYGVARMEQEFGPSGSTWSVMTTAVHRGLERGEPLAALLPGSAFTLSGDSVVRLKDGEYQVNASGGISYVEGDRQAIDRIQRASAHFLQRPDAPYARYDPRRTALAGGKWALMLERRNGRHWLWRASTQTESPEFETNDVGRLTNADGVTGNAELEYRETAPGAWYRNYSLLLATDNEWNFGRIQQNRTIRSGIKLTWPNFWTADLEAELNLRAQKAALTRGGPSMQSPQGWNLNLEMSTSSAARTRVFQEFEYARDEDGGLYLQIESTLAMQPAPQWSFSIKPQYQREVSTQQYVMTREDGGPATFGGRYIFARVDRSTYNASARLSYAFSPDLMLDLYAEPFAASGGFDSFGELAAARSRLRRQYGTDGTTMAIQSDGSRIVTDGPAQFALANRDFNVQSFRSNLVLRWEWRPGSTLYVVWQQDRHEEHIRSRRISIADMFSSPGVPGDHFIALKATFWIAP